MQCNMTNSFQPHLLWSKWLVLHMPVTHTDILLRQWFSVAFSKIVPMLLDLHVILLTLSMVIQCDWMPVVNVSVLMCL